MILHFNRIFTSSFQFHLRMESLKLVAPPLVFAKSSPSKCTSEFTRQLGFSSSLKSSNNDSFRFRIRCEIEGHSSNLQCASPVVEESYEVRTESLALSGLADSFGFPLVSGAFFYILGTLIIELTYQVLKFSATRFYSMSLQQRLEIQVIYFT